MFFCVGGCLYLTLLPYLMLFESLFTCCSFIIKVSLRRFLYAMTIMFHLSLSYVSVFSLPAIYHFHLPSSSYLMLPASVHAYLLFSDVSFLLLHLLTHLLYLFFLICFSLCLPQVTIYLPTCSTCLSYSHSIPFVHLVLYLLVTLY